eukprot:5205906-Prymnesium_polylepis.2
MNGGRPVHNFYEESLAVKRWANRSTMPPSNPQLHGNNQCCEPCGAKRWSGKKFGAYLQRTSLVAVELSKRVGSRV